MPASRPWNDIASRLSRPAFIADVLIFSFFALIFSGNEVGNQ